ncbi:branched-chain amino acid ABC transporter substrate-binding protein [Phaeacidiphilus oryzae]|uniref:branched-chain amino acid ABC transporter substrate-binding protein n=1 Tax=Phaeacidiphilus oryzae TaxID=348818 RepID=UPI000A8A1B6C|nr:branched-chain amino acid ABC transporter substrate-binding protein [Phaeacidiphilus oryzae]
MRHRYLLATGAVLAAGTLTLTACGSRNNGNGGGGGSSSSGNTVTIGVDAPLSGQNSATGLGIQYGVKIAVDQANADHTVPGVTFKLEAKDDQAQPATGQQNATALVADNSVVGTVGPLNSSVAQSMQQVFAAANMVEISPSNTNPALTLGANWQQGASAYKRTYNTYFRTATTDILQGAYAAQYAYQTGHRKVFVVDDQQTYGKGLATIFGQDFKKRGGTVVGTDHVTANPPQTDFSSLVSKIKASGADMLYYGGQYDQSELITKQMKNAGVKIPLFGGDGMFSDTYIKVAGTTAEGDLATSVGQPLDTVPTAKDFIATYKSKNYPGDYGTYGGYSYDAANAIINSVKSVVAANNGKLPSMTDLRSKVVQGVQAANFDGISGHVSFDKYGDTTNKQLTVYQVKNGKWVAVKTGNYTG